MKIIAGKRQSGKTTQLIYESAQSNIPIVCADFDAVKHISSQAKILGLEIPKPMCFSELKENCTESKILIDDLFLFAQFLSEKTIEVATIETPGRDFNQVNFYLDDKSYQPTSPQIGDSWQNSKGETFLFTSAGWENMEIKV